VLVFLVFVLMVAPEDRRAPTVAVLGVLLLLLVPFIVWTFRQTLSVNISPRGVTLVRRGRDKLIPFSRVKRIAPTVFVETSSWSFERSLALEIVTEKRMVLRIPEDDVRAIFYIWMGMSGRSQLEEGKEITKSVNQLEKRLYRAQRARLVVLVVVMAVTAALMLLLMPDVDVRGEEVSMPTQLLAAAMMALFMGAVVIMMHALAVNPLYSGELEGLNWWATLSNAQFRSKKDTPLGRKRIYRVLGDNYFIGGMFVAGMGAFVFAFGIIDMVTSPEPGSRMVVMFAGIMLILTGFGFSAKGWHMLRRARRAR